MSVKELQAGLEILVMVKAEAPPEERWSEALSMLAQHTAQALKVQPSEVAILLRTDDGTNIKFVYPPALSSGPNNFPLSAPSLAGDVVKSAKGVLDNAFAQTKHLSFYERMKVDPQKSGAIQKMVAAPIRGAGVPIGLIEVGRKGMDAAAAGPDFTAQDLAMLTEIGSAAAPFLLKLKPPLR